MGEILSVMDVVTLPASMAREISNQGGTTHFVGK